MENSPQAPLLPLARISAPVYRTPEVRARAPLGLPDNSPSKAIHVLQIREANAG